MPQDPFEVDAREVTETVKIFCTARIASGQPVSAETVKHYFSLAESIQAEGYALAGKVYKARNGA